MKLASKFAFGALKGLTVLREERYVIAQDFDKLLAEEVKAMMLRKAPAVLLDKLSLAR